MIVENEKEERTVKVFSRNTTTWVQIGTAVYTALGVSHFESEKDVESYFQNHSLNDFEIKNFHVTINHYDYLIEISCKYFELRLFPKNFVLHIEDKAPPEFVKNFSISNEEAFLLLKSIIARAETFSINF